MVWNWLKKWVHVNDPTVILYTRPIFDRKFVDPFIENWTEKKEDETEQELIVRCDIEWDCAI